MVAARGENDGRSTPSCTTPAGRSEGCRQMPPESNCAPHSSHDTKAAIATHLHDCIHLPRRCARRIFVVLPVPSSPHLSPQPTPRVTLCFPPSNPPFLLFISPGWRLGARCTWQGCGGAEMTCPVRRAWEGPSCLGSSSSHSSFSSGLPVRPSPAFRRDSPRSPRQIPGARVDRGTRSLACYIRSKKSY